MSGNRFISVYGGEVEPNYIPFPNGPPNPLQEGFKMMQNIDRSRVYKFENKASGIILIKQDYKKLFYSRKKLTFPLEEIQLLFFDKKQSDADSLKIIMNNSKIEISYTVRQKVGEDKIRDIIQRKQFKLNGLRLFPNAEEAPKMLQKKIWIQLNRLNRSLNIYTGDVVNYKGQQPIAKIDFHSKQKPREGWDNEADKFPMPNYQKPQSGLKKIIDPFTQIQFFYVNFKVAETSAAQKNQKRKINDYVSLQVLNLARIFDSVIQENVSLLKPNLANLESIPPALRNLYSCLKNLDIRNLPQFNDETLDYKSKYEYMNWRELQFALHHSLVGQWGYTSDNIPRGIMNHLYKMKCKKEYKEFNHKHGEFFLNKDQLLQQIYNNRAGYIRLQLLPHEGLGPGSMAVLQIWPPFHCSSIHNHGDAYGLIKVLSGAIRVQNFSELDFAALTNKPYMESDYYEDQYTWLSELSFGIHRLVNVKPQTCFTLQSYYHNEVTSEFFSVVKKDANTGQLSYIEYYPQNDWVNYLKEFNNPKCDNKDKEFIGAVIQKYGLMVNGKLDTSFHRLVLCLKKQYEYFHGQLATQYIHKQ